MQEKNLLTIFFEAMFHRALHAVSENLMSVGMSQAALVSAE